jgi:uncharacterized protein (TIGR02594 family)
MTLLPKTYQWLANEPAPKMLLEALRLYGIREKAGAANNPEIIAWAKECGISGYSADSIPWCGLFVAVVAKRAGKGIGNQPLWARSWAKWGIAAPRAELGDVLVFARQGGGHVGLYVGEDSQCYHVLGGNQGDSVSIARIDRSRCIAARRFYNIAAPANVRPIVLAASGIVSENEA